MTGKRRMLFSCLAAFTLVFSLIISSLTCYADVEMLDKQRTVKYNKPAYKEGELLIKFKDETSSEGKAAFASKNGLMHKKSFDFMNIGLYSVSKGKSTGKALNSLIKSNEVEFIQPNYLYYPASVPCDPDYNKLWGLNNTGQVISGKTGIEDVDIDAPEAWDITPGADDIVVAVIDTGIDINHPELCNRMWRNPGEIVGNNIDDDNNGYIDDIYGWDFYNDNNSVFDDEYDDEHGTHVAGTIAAEANGEGVIGVAPNVKIMSLKFIGPDGGSTADAIEAINYAKKMGVKVSNNSWGGAPEGEHDDTLLKQAIEQSGMLFVAAAGNSRRNTDTWAIVPGSFNSDNILNVAAVNNKGELAYYSNYGVTSVDVGAPGMDIYSTMPGIKGGIAAVGAGSYNAFVAAFGLEDLVEQADADDLLSKALNGIRSSTPILLVDDDGNDDTVYDDVYEVYSTALKNLGYTNIDVVHVASDISDGPSFADMYSHDVVIWFTGNTWGWLDESNYDEWVTTLSYNDQVNLIDYLIARKTLILFGRDALYDIENSNLVSNYFNIEIALSDYGRNMHIEGEGTTVFESVYYDISFGSQYERDYLEPILGRGAYPLLNYPDESGVFYYYMSGTSMAAPHVSGIAALLLSKNPNLTPRQMKTAIMSSGTPLDSLNGKTVTGKLANAYNALKVVAPANPTKLAASKSGANITLTWTGREVGDFKHYIVERKIDSGSYSAIGSTVSKSYIDSGIDAAKTYSYRVKAVDKYSNTSGYSNIVVGNEGISNSGSGGSSSSGGGGGSATETATPTVPNPSIDGKIQEALNSASNKENIVVSAIKYDDTESAAMSIKTIESLDKSGKSLTLTGTSTEITIPAAALMTEEVTKYLSDSTAELSISVKEIKGEEAKKLISNVEADMFKIGDRIFDFAAELKTSKDTINISKFGQELKLSIRLNAAEVAGSDANKLGAYYYNEDKKTWEYVGGVFDAKNSTLTFDTGHFSKYAVMRMEKSFADIENHWAKPEIELMVSRHIIDGVSNEEFGANREITRAEVVRMLVNVLCYSPDKNVDLIAPKTAAFKDVSIDSPDFTFIETAVKYGITKGNTDGTFRPNDTVTREQLTTMIIRAMNIVTDSDLSILPFDDREKIPDWAANSITAAYERGLVLGIGGNKFGVGSTATRAQGTVMVKRVMEKSGLLQMPSKITGKLVISNIEGQHYELETKDGVYVLQFDTDNKYLAKALGSMVEKDLELDGYEQQVFTVYQRGKVFKVISAKLN